MIAYIFFGLLLFFVFVVPALGWVSIIPFLAFCGFWWYETHKDEFPWRGTDE